MTPLNIKLAAMTINWANPKGDGLIPFLKEVKEAGYEGVSGFADSHWAEQMANPKEFGQQLADEGLELASMDIVSACDIDLVKTICESMAYLNCKHLVCLGGVGTAADDYPELAPVLERIGEISLSFGIKTAYHNGRTQETIANMETVLAHASPDKVFAMCDTGHATRDFVELPHPERAPHFMRKHWDRLDFIEFKDWNEETDLNTPVGDGLCDWEAVFDLIKEKEYEGWVLVEQNGHEDPTSKGRTPLECAKISREFIRNGLGV
ncbi:MAG: TIM barrel protein [Candidatus Latescibacteria bacterium]|nr:TIM barrel protein [Candidatus Latescibacterota bacterium]MBT4140347.1 TIM barrel protein [Candidatus Latescibacterota bacterium]MBT5832990.1 TIM barrel protein [Candidatus Latescibacterota bacterium]